MWAHNVVLQTIVNFSGASKKRGESNVSSKIGREQFSPKIQSGNNVISQRQMDFLPRSAREL